MEEKTAEYNDDLLLNYKINILNNANKGNILDLCVVSTFLKINFIKIDNKLIVTNIIGKNKNNIGKYLFFIEKDEHLESILKIGFLDRNSNVKNAAQNLQKLLTVLYEKNKKIKLELNDKKMT